MIVISRIFLLALLLAVCICYCHAAPLGKKERFVRSKHRQRTLDKSTERDAPSEPIKVLRSTDHDVIIQVRRTPFKLSKETGRRDEEGIYERSDESVYNKHTKSKYRSEESDERLTKHNDGKEIVHGRISRLSMHRLPTRGEQFRSKEFIFKDAIRIQKGEKHGGSFEKKNGESDSRQSKFEDNNKDEIYFDLDAKDVPLNTEQLRSKEFISKEPIRLLEGEKHANLFEKKNGQSNSKQSKFEDNNKDDISDLDAIDEGYSEISFNENKRLKDLKIIDISLPDKENRDHNLESIEKNYPENSRDGKEFGSKTTLYDRKNKRELTNGSSKLPELKSLREISELTNGSFKLPELKSLRERIIDLRTKFNPIKALASVNDEIKEKSLGFIQNKLAEENSKHIPKLLTSSLKNISFKRNDLLPTILPVPTTSTITTSSTTEAYPREQEDSSRRDLFEPLRKKVIHTRSPSFDSLQDLKRKLKSERKIAPLFPGNNLPLPPLLRERPPEPPVYAPPSDGQYYLPQRPVIVVPTEDPVLQAERAHTALQRMILFVNAMGKFDYYISHAARNFVDLLTSHTHDYDKTVRRRLARGDGECGNKKDEKEEEESVEEDEDDDDDDDHGKGGYVRIRASKSRRHDNERGRSGEDQSNLHHRDRERDYEIRW